MDLDGDEYNLEAQGTYSRNLQTPSISGNQRSFEMYEITQLREQASLKYPCLLKHLRLLPDVVDVVLKLSTTLFMHHTITMTKGERSASCSTCWTGHPQMSLFINVSILCHN